MPKKTQSERYAASLVARGWEEVASNSRKFRRFTKGGETPLYLGKAGSLRKGNTIAKSHPAPDAFKRALLAETPQ
jgi:hypothetical protein